MIAHVAKALSSMTVVSLSTKDRLGGLFFKSSNIFKLLHNTLHASMNC